VRPVPAVPANGSFFTIFAAFAFPLVLVCVDDDVVELVAVVVVCPTAVLAPTTTSARTLTPHNHAFAARDILLPLNRSFCDEHGHRSRYPRYASCTAAFSRISSGLPTAITCPRLSTTIVSQCSITKPTSCSTRTTAQPRSRHARSIDAPRLCTSFSSR